MSEAIENIFSVIVEYAVLLAEAIGVGVLVWTIIRCFISLIKHGPHTKLELARGISLALEFKMCGEVLRTVIVREWNELLILGAIFILRAAMTLLSHWEIKNEELEEAALEEHNKE